MQCNTCNVMFTGLLAEANLQPRPLIRLLKLDSNNQTNEVIKLNYDKTTGHINQTVYMHVSMCV